MTTRRLVTNNNLIAALLKLETSNLPLAHRKALKRLVAVHKNPNAQQPDVVARAMRKARQIQVIGATKALAGVLGQAGQRGAVGLTLLSDIQWNELVSRANED